MFHCDARVSFVNEHTHMVAGPRPLGRTRHNQTYFASPAAGSRQPIREPTGIDMRGTIHQIGAIR